MTDSRYATLTQKKRVYMPYFPLGFPTAAVSLKVVKLLLEEGVDGLELGLPFRDAVADGPIIQAAANQALDKGFTVDKALELVEQIRALNDSVPITLMCYYNMLIARGPEKFIRDFARAGIDGILIPDLPPERAAEVLPFAEKYGLKVIFIASVLSDVARLKLIASVASGFVYVVPRLGITGFAGDFERNLQKVFRRVKMTVPLPAIAGFGIAGPQQAEEMFAAGADGVISGSKLVQLVGGAYTEDHKSAFEALRKHTRSMMKATRNV